MGLPCGTSSRARDRPVAISLQRLGVPSPNPLRTANHPLRIPSLSTLDLGSHQGTEGQCAVRARTGSHLVFLAKRQIILSVENPLNSRLWTVFIQLTLSKSLDDKRIDNSLELVRFIPAVMGQRGAKTLDGLVHQKFSLC